MKKFLLLAASCMVLLSACEKEANVSKPTEKEIVPKYPYSVKVSGFTQTTAPFSIGDGSGKATLATTTMPFDKLTFMIFDKDGKLVSRMEQINKNGSTSLYRVKADIKTLINSTSTFGAITDSLPTGNYNLLAVGTPIDATFNGPQVVKNNALVEAYKDATWTTTTLYPNVSPMSGSLFMYDGPLGVSTTNVPVGIAVNRIHGGLTLNIEDVIPANTYSISVTIKGESIYYNTRSYVSGGTAPDMVTGRVLTAADHLGANMKLSWLLLNTATPLTIVIEAKDSSLNTIATKTVSNLTLVRNKMTTISGALFQKAASVTVVSVNDTWDTGTTVKF
jgi:hypothetical protein